MRALFLRIRDSLWGAAGTVVVHALILIILAASINVGGPRLDDDAPVIDMIIDVEPPPDLTPIEKDLEFQDAIPTAIDAMAIPEVSPDSDPPPVDAAGAFEDPDWDVLDFSDTISRMKFKDVYVTRTKEGRQKALHEHGGGMHEQTERSVLRALAWLRDHQAPDGSWGPQYPAAMTGLSLLAMLAHGETTRSPEYGTCVRKGLQYLLRRQRDGVFRGGGWADNRRLYRNQVESYEHAIATYAVSEAYGLTGIPPLRYAMEDAVAIIIDSQHSGGTWDYGYQAGPEAQSDISLAGWHVQALKAASLAGARNAGLHMAIETAVRGMKAMAGAADDGLFAYSSRSEHRKGDMSMTSVAVLCMQLTGHALDAEARSGMGHIRKTGFSWINRNVHTGGAEEAGAWPFYMWYYLGQARFHQGGRTWITWNRRFAPELCASQNEDGSWCPAPQSAETRYGPVYHTALGTLMLEVYYRVLPTYQKIETQIEHTERKPDEDEIVIRFGSEPT